MLAMLGAACGKADVRSPGSDGRSAPRGADELILRVFTEGGFVPVEFNLRNLPEFTLTGDGRVFSIGAQIEIYPPPALPPLLVRPIESDAVAKIIAEAKAAGLDGPDKEYRYDLVADAGTTVFTFVDDDGVTHTIRAYALGFEADGGDAPPGQTAEEREARAKLAKLREKLLDLSSWLPRESLGEDKVYEIEKLRVFAKPYETPNPDEGQQVPKAWPLGSDLATFGEAGAAGYRCGVLEGADLEKALKEFQASNTRTPWTSNGKQYELILRPLLPDESGCPK
ncbi:MAG TPA: hypothetical protein VM841_07550 [Actinomycetota bacterium]|nr:hypothetical protein [Actinomycetota bacterium]